VLGGADRHGESDDDVVSLAFALRDLEIDSIPVNFLIPFDETPFGDMRNLNPRYCLKVLSLFRFANPAREIRIAGGREVHLRSLQPMGLYPANSIFVSDYLTSKGQAAEDDFRMLEDLGFEIVGRGTSPKAEEQPHPNPLLGKEREPDLASAIAPATSGV